jgi:hypothetical protein
LPTTDEPNVHMVSRDDPLWILNTEARNRLPKTTSYVCTPDTGTCRPGPDTQEQDTQEQGTAEPERQFCITWRDSRLCYRWDPDDEVFRRVSQTPGLDGIELCGLDSLPDGIVQLAKLLRYPPAPPDDPQ